MDATIDTGTDRIVDAKELCRLVPYSPMHVWRLERAGKFPKRIKIGPGRVGWSMREVQLWIAARKAERHPGKGGEA